MCTCGSKWDFERLKLAPANGNSICFVVNKPLYCLYVSFNKQIQNQREKKLGIEQIQQQKQQVDIHCLVHWMQMKMNIGTC